MPTLAAALRRESRRPDTAALHELLAPCAFAGPAVLTKRGDLFRVQRLKPVDAECLEPDSIAAVCSRFDGAMRTLGAGYRVYQYLFKRSSPEMAAASGTGIAAKRAVWLAARSRQMYGFEAYLVILRSRPSEEGPRQMAARWSMRHALDVSVKRMARETEALDTAVNSIAVQLRDVVGPAPCTREETLRFLRCLVNTDPALTDLPGVIHDFHLDQQIAASEIKCWPRHLEQSGNYIRMLSLTVPPAQTFPHLLRALLAVPCSMTVCSEWKREHNQTARREIDKRRRHYHLAKTSMLFSGGNSNTNTAPRPHEVLIDDSKTAVVEELNRALREMEVNENHFGRFALTVALHHEDEAALRQAVPKVIEVFATHDARLVEENYNMLNAWAAMVPGNYEYSLRQMWMLNTTWSDLSFLFAPGEGDRINSHLAQPALAVVETESSTPWYLNLHVQDVAHTCVLGSTGSGKTFLLNFLISCYQQYSPYTVIFDLLGNYRRLTEEFGGGYLYASRQNECTINPFSLPPTPENLDFLFSFVRVLAEAGGQPLTADERKDLHRAVADVYELDPEVRRLSTLAQMCCRTYSRRLDEWVGTGRLAGYFDHIEDTLTLRQFQTFDFEGMDKPEVLEPLLFYILHRANVTCRQDRSVPKLIVFDEAWRFFRNPVTRDYIHEALKTGRNFNLAMIVATQSGDDLLRSELLATVAESCLTRIFLANPGMAAAAYRETFGLNSTEAEQIAHLIPKRQFLLKQPTRSKVLNLLVDPESFRLFSGKDQL